MDARRDVAGAARDIDDVGAALGREPVDHGPAPQAVDAAAHQIVHQVVAPGDAIEEAAHERGLFRRPHPPRAEVRPP